MGRKSSWLLGLLLVGACASANTTTVDAGDDMTAAMCEPKTQFPDCSKQCGQPICVIATAYCAGTTWVCDCASATVCAHDMAQHD